jgi:peptide/nickel transport system ATP-binding protein
LIKKILEINQLTVKTRGQGVPIVKNISLHIGEGEVVGLVGESGAGKTLTSLSILNLLHEKSALKNSGSIQLNIEDEEFSMLSIDKKTLRNIRKTKIGLVFQEPMTALNPLMTCGKQVMEILIEKNKINPLKQTLFSFINFSERVLNLFFQKDISLLKSGPYHTAKQEVIDWFSKLKIELPELTFNKYPHELSGGQKQRIIIAMALIKDPLLLLADEPTTALDKFTQDSIIKDLRILQKEKKLAVLFVSHDLNLIKSIADRIYIMKNGEIIEDGDKNDIFNNPKHLYTRDLLASCPPMDRKLKELPSRKHFLGFDEEGYLGDVNISLEKLIDTLTIESSIAIEKSNSLLNSPPLMTIENLDKIFISKRDKRKKIAIKNLSFNIYKGETLGIVGESGSGKSTLGKILVGLSNTDRGSVCFNGENIHLQSKKELLKFRKNVQIVFQDPYSSLNPSQSVFDTLKEPLLVHEISKKNDLVKDIDILLRQVGLAPDTKDKYPSELSGGQRQRVCIARALAVNPELIVFDESVSSLDVSVKADILNLLNKLKAENQLTFVFISHDLSVIRFISDRVLIMKNGEMIELGISEEIFTKPKEIYSKELLDLDY